MYDAAIDGRLQVTAALSLLERSMLVNWEPDSSQFVPAQRKAFESSWRNDVDPVFGRLICWINFSAGAEFLAKGVCLLNEVEIRMTDFVPEPPGPSTELSEWPRRFLKDWKTGGILETTYFGTLGGLVNRNRKTKADPPLHLLCLAAHSTREQ